MAEVAEAKIPLFSEAEVAVEPNLSASLGVLLPVELVEVRGVGLEDRVLPPPQLVETLDLVEVGAVVLLRQGLPLAVVLDGAVGVAAVVRPQMAIPLAVILFMAGVVVVVEVIRVLAQRAVRLYSVVLAGLARQNQLRQPPEHNQRAGVVVPRRQTLVRAVMERPSLLVLHRRCCVRR